jgi:NifU-like protein involved in Fe-S cluster formation
VASATALYTPQVLGLATSLAEWPWDPGLEFQGAARSLTCGSTITVGVDLAADGQIQRIGLKVHACAIGQAAAAIFAGGALGLDQAALSRCEKTIEQWLQDVAALPDWPQLSLIAAARDYPARHSAIMLSWKAALAALPSGQNPR